MKKTPKTAASHDSSPGKAEMYEPGTFEHYQKLENGYPSNSPKYSPQTDSSTNSLPANMGRGMSDEQLYQLIGKSKGWSRSQFEEYLSKTASTQVRLSFEPHEKLIFDKLLKGANALGLKIYLAGGLLRDRLSGVENSDLDFVVSKDSAKLGQWLARQYGLTSPITMDRSEATMINLDNMSIDLIDAVKVFSTMKTKEGLEEGQESELSIFMDDAYRRDLTINSLLYGLDDNKLYDPTGKGISDIETKTIRTIIDPMIKYKVHAPDMLRALRFYATKEGYQFAPGILEAMKANIDRITPRQKGGDISSRRIERELRKAKTPEQWQKFKGALSMIGADIVLVDEIRSVDADKQGGIKYNFDKEASYKPLSMDHIEIQTGLPLEFLVELKIGSDMAGRPLPTDSALPSHQTHVDWARHENYNAENTLLNQKDKHSKEPKEPTDSKSTILDLIGLDSTKDNKLSKIKKFLDTLER